MDNAPALTPCPERPDLEAADAYAFDVLDDPMFATSPDCPDCGTRCVPDARMRSVCRHCGITVLET